MPDVSLRALVDRLQRWEHHAAAVWAV